MKNELFFLIRESWSRFGRLKFKNLLREAITSKVDKFDRLAHFYNEK
jgi:hypothetical protein